MLRLSPMIALLALCACAGKEPPLTKVQSLSESEMVFEARAGMEYPESDADAEATRIKWLEEELAERNMCPNGYTIADRMKILAEEEALGQTDNIAYRVVCK